jgi:DNA repair exonuclease SbcCD ATPase subunit
MADVDFIGSLTLCNWMRFRGLHRIQFGAGPHAVVAEWESDKRRSNWGGKTATLSGVGFVLYGEHPFSTEDEWITDGEPDGYAEIQCCVGDPLGAHNDTWRIKRSRTRGASTKLVVSSSVPTIGDATGEAAQELIETRIVGLTFDEFVESCWLRQKKHAAFLSLRPAERVARAREWAQLLSVEAAHDIVKNRLRQATNDLAKANASVDELTFTVASLDKEAEAWKPADEMRDRIDVIKSELAAYAQSEKDYEAYRVVVDKCSEFETKKLQLEAALEATRAGTHNKSNIHVDTMRAENPHEKFLDASAKYKAAVDETRRTKALQLGEFDGKCPVNGKNCPIASEICADTEAADAAWKVALDAQNETKKTLELWTAKREQLAQRETKLGELQGQLDAVASYLTKPLPPAVAKPGPLGPIDALDEEKNRLQGTLSQMEFASGQRRTLTKRLDDAKRLQSEAKASIELDRPSCEVLGRAGAQRVLARDVVERIQQRANFILSNAEIDLRVRLEWGKETQRLEPACPSCGEVHPAASKVARCRACGVERIRARTDGLEVTLSNRSGAAEDLAGLALSLAVGSLVRARKGSTWPLVMVDEPFSALDEANSENLAKQLGRLLGGADGFRQSLIVAHSRRVTDSLPNQVVIHASAHGSSIR